MTLWDDLWAKFEVDRAPESWYAKVKAEGDKNQEKAEKWDEMQDIWDNAPDKSLMGSAYSLRQAQKKLEAAKKQVERYDDSLYHGDWIRELKKILGEEA